MMIENAKRIIIRNEKETKNKKRKSAKIENKARTERGNGLENKSRGRTKVTVKYPRNFLLE